MGLYLPPFETVKDGEFQCRNFFRAGGRIWSRKQAFDKTVVNERVLRQLYEARQIAPMDDIDAELLAAELSSGPQLSDEDRADEMVKRYNRKVLLERAAGLDIPPNANKKVIALALVSAGRADP